MAQFSDLHICLYTGYTPRANALKERVQKAGVNFSSIDLTDSMNGVQEKTDNEYDSVIMLDLPNIKQSAIKTISAVKEITPGNSKLIAIHIYTTKLLIDPLFEAGIHGYLTYEPSADEIKDAVCTVGEGNMYLPDQIY